MTLPNLPTDNYYKFFALGGLTIALSSVLFFSSRISDLFDEIDVIKADLELLEYETEHFASDSNRLDSALTKLEKSVPDSILTDTTRSTFTDALARTDKLLNDKNYREYFEFIVKYGDKIIPQIAKLDRIRQKHSDQLKISNELQKKTDEILVKNNTAKRKLNRLILLFVVLLILLLTGIKMAKYGFNQWYLKVQKPSDEKLALELEKLKNENTK